MHEQIIKALKSDGFKPIIYAIQQRCPVLAEAILMDSEADHAEHESEYTWEENCGIKLAFDECRKRIERLNQELRGEVDSVEAVFR